MTVSQRFSAILLQLLPARRALYRWPTIYSGGAALIFGFTLIGPWATFTTAPVYVEMAGKAPEWAWGLAYAALGLLQLYADRLPWPWGVALARLAVSVSLAYLAFLFGLGNFRGTGWPNHSWDALMASGLFLVDAGAWHRQRLRRRRDICV